MGLLGQLNAATTYFWLNTEPADILNQASALLWRLMGNAQVNDNWTVKPHEIVDGGLMIKVMLEYANSNAGEYGANTVINQSKVNILDAARFRWAGIYGSNTLNLDDLTQCTGDEAIVSLTKQYMQSIIKSARVQMATDIIAAATSVNKINGLGDLFNTTTSTEYGSISTDEMARWKTNVITESEPLGCEAMQRIFRAVNMGDAKNMKPNFCVTTAILKDGYERSLHPQQRYSNTDMIAAGWENITHKGAPIVSDNNVTAGYMEALNLNHLSLRSHKDYNFTTPEWIAKKEAGQPDVITANTRWRGNLFCTNRRMHVRHTNLTEPA